jgi:hypothetical protein
MDGQRFDDLTRLVASGVPRRRVLGMIGGGLAAIVGKARSGSAQTCLNPGEMCITNPAGCCPGSICDIAGTFMCVPIAPVCSDVEEPCSNLTGVNLPCCPGLVCSNTGICVVPEPVCAAEGETCGAVPQGLPVIDCCDGLVCQDNVCVVPEPVCAAEGETCGLTAGLQLDCCDGLVCIDGTCAVPDPVCAAEGESCSMADGVLPGCCDGLVCADGICVVPGPTCAAEGETCEADADCCDGICCGGTCRSIECCIDDPNPNSRCGDGQACNEGVCEGVDNLCANDSECAGDTCCCQDGTCSANCCDPGAVTDLPNTGAGAGTSRSAGWLGAAAAGAAAAYLGGKKLREQTNTPESAE